MDGLVIGPGSLIPPADKYSEVLDCDLRFTSSGDAFGNTTWSALDGQSVDFCYDGDVAVSGSIDDDEDTRLQAIVESDSAETVKFYWKVSSEHYGDYLQFYIDDTLKDEISGEVDWTLKSYAVSAGIHTLKLVYEKDGSDEDGDDCGWVDFVQWTGPSPAQDPSNWQEIAYKHDVLGRRVEKKLVVSSSNPVDGYSTRYVYDGGTWHGYLGCVFTGWKPVPHDGNDNLLRKYIHGPGVNLPSFAPLRRADLASISKDYRNEK